MSATAFDTLTDALAGFGLTLSEKTALAFGAPVLKGLADAGKGGKVFVACKGGAKILELQGKLSDDAAKIARFVDATSADYAKVRPHVVNYGKGRKIAVVTAMIKDGDDSPIGFTVTRKA